ncbi:hypothetical protein [Telluribacter humicola]|uniref:hypothetical protein n=1 Tax=Telluribacter humicola TaxID=1720261 RepID=UPI001A9758DD|nr:hypothetical protein [Telluribacter humicola]
MKKHPVDDLFARKLNTWEPEPSSDVWQRIQAGQQKKQRRLGGWYWYAAASVALVLTVGYVVWKGQADESTPLGEKSLAKVQMPVQQTPARPADQQAAEPSMNTEVYQVPADVKGPVTSSQEREALAMGTAREKASEVESVADKELEPALRMEVATLSKEEVSTPATTITSPELSVPATQPVEDISKALRQNAENRVVIAHVEVEDELDDNQKSSRLIRILRQLKNAKEGEAVNWNEVGINPKKLMARADERIRNEEEKVSKQYNTLKEKLEL